MAKSSRVLVIDDNLMNVTILKSLLSDYTVQTASSGSEALAMIAQFRPDVVLLDIVMPGIDGYATCRRIRATPTLRHTKIIMVSGKSALEERLAGYEAGADDYITKPFDGEELLAKVRVYLKLKSLEEVEEVKNHTIEILQHSNRTPLNNIISYAELLAWESNLDEESKRDAPRIILRHAHRLHRLLEKGELLANLKAGRLAFSMQPGDLCRTVRGAVQNLKPQIDQRDVCLKTELCESAPTAYDAPRLDYAVRALLDNAVRYSPPAGEVRVKVQLVDDAVECSVSDEGPGIADELLPAVFQPFGDPESPLFNRGDGLSLAIVQQIVWAHEGDIWVDSRLGHGATFALRIPIVTDASSGLTACDEQADASELLGSRP